MRGRAFGQLKPMASESDGSRWVIFVLLLTSRAILCNNANSVSSGFLTGKVEADVQSFNELPRTRVTVLVADG